MTIRVAFGGPIGAGKSTVVVSTMLALTRDGHSCRLYEEPYSDTHAVILGLKPAHRRNKRIFVQQPTLDRLRSDIESDEADIVLIDLPGKITSTCIPPMLASVDAAILVGRTVTEADLAHPHRRRGTTDLWREFFSQRGLPLIAEVQSWRFGQPSWVGAIQAPDLERKPQFETPWLRLLTQKVHEFRGRTLVQQVFEGAG